LQPGVVDEDVGTGGREPQRTGAADATGGAPVTRAVRPPRSSEDAVEEPWAGRALGEVMTRPWAAPLPAPICSQPTARADFTRTS
jgi:hypothetical protein